MKYSVKNLWLLPLVAFVSACLSQGEKKEDVPCLTWGCQRCCVESPVAPGEDVCYKIEVVLDTLAGDGVLAARLNAVLADSVMGFHAASLSQAVTAFVDSIESQWKMELEEFYDPDAEDKDLLEYSFQVKGSPVETSSADILSYLVEVDTYQGGAHGSHYICYYNFSIADGRLMRLQDVIPEEHRGEVLASMMARLCRDNGVANQTELQEQTGITMLGDLYLTQNFLPDEDSITFFFNQYEIAPYSSGIIGVTVPMP